MSKLTDKTLGEAALNQDGRTYHGPTVIQWLFEAVTGTPMSEDEAYDLIDEAQQKARANRAAEAEG
jgi:hypothetical protein